MAAPEQIPNPNEERVSLSGQHVEITPAIREFVRTRFGPLLERSQEIVRIDVRLRQDQVLGDKPHFTATGQIEIRGPDLISHTEGQDAYGVLEGLAEQLDRLLRRRRGRRLGKRDHPGPTELEAPLPKIPPADDAEALDGT